MSQPQRLIFEDGDNSYEVFIDTVQPVRSIAAVEDEYISKSPTLRGAESIIPPAVIVELEKVHHTIRGYTQYAIGAFKNFAIEVKCKFPQPEKPTAIESQK